MNTYTASQLKTKLTSIASANDAGNLQAVFVNVVHQSLVMGNNMPEHILAVRNSNAPQAFKAALAKYLPLTYNKAKNAYEYSRVKAEKLRTMLGVELANEQYVCLVDELAAKLPDIFEKAPRLSKEFDLDDYCKKVGEKLGKEGVSNGDMLAQILAHMAAHPETVGMVADLVLEAASVKAA